MKPRSNEQAKRRVRGDESELAAAINDLILAQCHPHQRDAVLDDARRITFLIGRGGTKTTTMMFRALRKLSRIRSGRVVYCASSRPMAEELMWSPLKDTCDWLGLEIGKDIEFNETKLRLTFLATGTTMRLVGVDDKKEIDKLRGQPFDEVLIDEASVYPPELLDNLVYRVIGPRLGDRLGTIVMGGTPGHILRGLFYDATRIGSTMHRPWAERDKEGFTDWIGWSSHAWSLEDVVALPDAAKRYPALVNLHNDHLEEKLRNQWSDDNPIWLREFCGKWSSDNTESVFKFRAHVDGKPWNEWDPLGGQAGGTLQALRRAIASLPSEFKDWRYVVGCDTGGSKDPFACNIFAFAPQDQDRRIFHVFSFEQMGMYARLIARLCLGDKESTDKPEGIWGVIGWPDACAMDSDQGTIDELKKEHGLQFVKQERARDYKFGAIELVNGDLIDGRIKILKGSPLYQQLQELQWQQDTFGNLQENKAQANHSTDCLVYARKAIATLFETGTVEAPKPKTEVNPALTGPRPWEDKPKSEFESIVGGDDNFDAMFEDGNGNYF